MRRTPAFTAAALVTLAAWHRRQQRHLQRRQRRAAASRCRSATPIGCTQLQMLYPDGTRTSSLSAPDFMSVRGPISRCSNRSKRSTLSLPRCSARAKAARDHRRARAAAACSTCSDCKVATRARLSGRRKTSPASGQRGDCSVMDSGSACSAAIRRARTERSPPRGHRHTIIGVTSPDSSGCPTAPMRIFPLDVRSTPTMRPRRKGDDRSSCRCSARAKPVSAPVRSTRI